MRILQNHMRFSISSVPLLCTIIGFLLFMSLSAKALTPGDRCQSTSDGVRVRDYPTLDDLFANRSLGDRGHVLSGPESALLNGTTYQWYLVFWDDGVMGWSAGDFLAVALKPTITISAASNIGTTSVTLNGSINANNNTASCKFEYGTSSSYGDSTGLGDIGGNSTLPITCPVTGLEPDTLYHVRLTVEFYNGVEQRSSSEVTFRTDPVGQPPTASTGSGTPLNDTGALLAGTVNPKGDATDAWFEWGSSTSYGNTTPATAVGSGNVSASHGEIINGLAFGATYHYRLVAQNSFGTTYGSDRSFTMPIQRPSVQTLAASSVQKFSSTLNGNLNPNGNSCSMWFEWGVTASYGSRTSGGNYSGSRASYATFSESLTGLEPGKTYHYRACASNVSGPTYGSDTTFQAQYRVIGPGLTVAPVDTTSFGSIEVGHTSDRIFTVYNSGSAALSGNATASEPFNVIAGGSYTLAPGETKNVAVRYAPFAAGNHLAAVAFTGGAGESRQVMGSAFVDPVPTTGEIVGQVTSSQAPNQPLSGIRVRAYLLTENISESMNGGAKTVTGSGSQAGSYRISGLTPNALYHVSFEPPMDPRQEFYKDEKWPLVTVLAGQTTAVNMSLTPIPPGPPSSLPPKETPVVLVRGTGPDTSWIVGNTESEWGYWKKMRNVLSNEFQQVWDCNEPDSDSGHNPSFPVRKGLGHVINGENGIQQNGWNLHDFVMQKARQFNRDKGYFPPEINIIAHSMGGLITRSSMISNGTFCWFEEAIGKWVTIKVGKVVMIATPNAGSAMASLLISTGLDYEFATWRPSWPATKDLTTEYVQGHFNGDHKWPANVKLFLSGGDGGLASPDWWLANCARALAGKAGWFPPVNLSLPPEQVNDGMVTWPSVQGLFHKRSFPMLNLLQYTSVSLKPSHTPVLFNFDHLQLLDSPDVTDWAVSALEGTLSGSMMVSRSSMVSSPEVQSADATNSLPRQQFELIGGTLNSGASNALPVMSDASTSLHFLLFSRGSGMLFRVQSPSGTILDASTPTSDTNVQYSAITVGTNSVMMTYTINDPTTGTWRAMVDGSIISTQANWSLMVSGDSTISLLPQTGSLFNQGQDVVVSAALANLGTDPATPIENAIIGATVILPDGTSTNLALLDNGMSHDCLPSDGVYAAVLANVQQSGDYAISYRATASNTQNQAFQRVLSGTFSVSSENASLWGSPSCETIDIDGDGIGDILKVMCWVNPKVSGNFSLSGDLINNVGSQFGKSSQFSSDGSGPMGVTLIFDLSEIRAVGGDGNYNIENLQLFEVTSNRVTWVAAYHGASSIQLAPTITTQSPLAIGGRDFPYELTLTATGGVSPYTWAVVSNSLPDGLVLAADTGVISGTPTVGSDYTIVAQVTGSDGLFSMKALSLCVTNPPGPSELVVTVTGPDGVSPLENIYVQLCSFNGMWWDAIATGNTDASGSMCFGGVGAGIYRMQFFDWSGTYVGETYDNVANGLDKGTNIVVPVSSSVLEINASLALPSRIIGTVTGPDGVTPLEIIDVIAYRWNGSSWNFTSADYTHAGGYYEIGGLGAGVYRVTFSDRNGNYVSEAYDNVPGTDFYNSGVDIIVSEGSTVSGINASLSLASVITGTVTGPDGVSVLYNVFVGAYMWNGMYWFQKGYGSTDWQGNYAIKGLAAGTYRVRFSHWSGSYVAETYANAIDDLNSGTDLSVPASLTVSNINASLDNYASLGGTVVKVGGSVPAANVTVWLFDSARSIFPWSSRKTDGFGRFLFGSLHPGTYAVRVDPSPDGNDLAQWYNGEPYLPGQVSPPPVAALISLGSGASVTNVDFIMLPAGRISGAVKGAGFLPIANAKVWARGVSYGQVYLGQTDGLGNYGITGLLPDFYKIKVTAPAFQDEWWNKVNKEALASPVAVAIGDNLVYNFDLALGQSPALVEVTSDPAGATVYLDYQITTNVTPTVLDIGEVDDSIWAASHVVTVKKDGRPWPSPRPVTAIEAQTVSVHFDLTSSESGGLDVSTEPEGTEVYVDYADTSVGVSPVVVGNLAPGSHVVLLRQNGHLQPRPLLALVSGGATNCISVSLMSNSSPDRVIADVRSVPPGVSVYVDYLSSTNVTDVVVDWMDPASRAGTGWGSASHVIMLRRAGYAPTLPRYATTLTNQPVIMTVNLRQDISALTYTNGGGLPDQWLASYDLLNRAPGKCGAHDDADGDGMSNEQEMLAGTNPFDPNSSLAIVQVPKILNQGGSIQFVFDTVPGRTYVIQGTDDLTGGWSNLTGTVLANDYQATFTTVLSNGVHSAFYRIVVLGL